MTRPLRFFSLAAILLGLALPAAADASAPIRLTDYRQLVQLISPQFSPDGGQIAFVTLRPDFRLDRYDAALCVVDIQSGRLRVLVSGVRGLQMPSWSPDGRRLAFIAKADKEESQIYAVAAGGGTPVDLSHAPNGVEQLDWSPNGRTIAYVTPDDSPLSAEDRRRHRDLIAIHDDDYQINRAPVPSHIWVLSPASGKSRQLTFGPAGVLEDPPPFGGAVSAPTWSADGRWIIYTRQADADDGDTDETTVAAVEVKSHSVHLITGRRSYEYTPSFASKGNAIAYLHPASRGPVGRMDLFVTSLAGGTGRDLSARVDRNIFSTYAWLPEGRGLVAIAHDHVSGNLYALPLDGPPHALALGGLNPMQVAVSAQGALAVIADTAGQAPELYLLRTLNSPPASLTHINRALGDHVYSRSVEVTWHAPDGEPDDGILTFPAGYVAGRHYALVVYSHGGPDSASTEHFDAGDVGPLRQLFAAAGVLVFEPNYRGSDNLGSSHEYAIYRDPGAGPDSDVISGIETVERQGIVDERRIAVVGHSYGGFMTAWLISHHHFWRCAVVADGVLDWTEEYALSGAGNLAWTRDSLGGTPWDAVSADLYRTGSPITYAAQISTPTLILSGTADITVPMTESFLLYHALRDRRVPVRFIAIPGATHSPQDPVHRELYYHAIARWVIARLRRREPFPQM